MGRGISLADIVGWLRARCSGSVRPGSAPVSRDDGTVPVAHWRVIQGGRVLATYRLPMLAEHHAARLRDECGAWPRVRVVAVEIDTPVDVLRAELRDQIAERSQLRAEQGRAWQRERGIGDDGLPLPRRGPEA